jgi:hypothetical protein
MPQQKLDRPQVAGLLVDLRHLCATHRMRTVCAGLQTNRRHPVTDNPRILAGRNVNTIVKPAGPKVFGPEHQRVVHPLFEGSPGAFRDFEADRFLGLALQDRRPFLDLAGRHDIDDLHPDQIATAQLAVDGQVKERQVAMVLGQLKPNPDRPDMFGLKRSFLADDPAFVPGWTQCANGG